MNERLLELYKQARVLDTFKDPSNNMLVETTSFSADLFAELIVNECSQKLSTLAKAYEGSESDSDYADAFIDAADIIKEHFGVE